MSSSGFTFTRVKDQMIQQLLDMGIKDFRILDALSQVPRHIFLDQALWSRAYENRALTIGYKQTISQPYIVARMTEHLLSHTSKRGKVLNKVLEIGSGCGYQSAVLSHFANDVFAVERIKPLVSKSRENLSELKIRNVIVKHADGFNGWDEDLKFDGIMCAAAAAHIIPSNFKSSSQPLNPSACLTITFLIFNSLKFSRDFETKGLILSTAKTSFAK